MRAKSTLLTAIAAGIVFLGGMFILGKNPFSKKEQMKKDYVNIPGVEIIGSIEETKASKGNGFETVADANLKEKNLKEASMKQKKLSEQEKLLNILQVVLLDTPKEKVTFNNKKETVRVRQGKRLELAYQGYHMTMTKNQKQLHKIREPSIDKKIQIADKKIQIANDKVLENDKGG